MAKSIKFYVVNMRSGRVMAGNKNMVAADHDVYKISKKDGEAVLKGDLDVSVVVNKIKADLAAETAKEAKKAADDAAEVAKGS